MADWAEQSSVRAGGKVRVRSDGPQLFGVFSHERAVEVGQPCQARNNLGVGHASPAIGKASGVQVFKQNKDSIGTLLNGQALGHPASIEAPRRETLIPGCLDVIRL